MRSNYFRIKVPIQPGELVALAELVMKKHEEDGDGSILKIINVEDFVAKVRAAAIRHAEALQLRMASEKATEDRNKMLGIAKDQFSSTSGTILYYVKAIREILLGVFKGSEQSLGDWGYEVNSSPRPLDDGKE